ncbi:hypothetical protein ACRE_018470 [Hapsidospora chrysogenum ATCC 11550]|uniref:Uncharacterized protein n=1 Tax=Hapsidospora chrysogenum (strain ATCC 11550 / CBS 779.69 / DSM 880 / IAM 14645 / JCM 23072 / IMI 49137) TaxID=857340 RepID=A0A086TCY0_HAPC1|nr:hypothetical protein ACRE_018470 [Hapsidospora chrysogenum ATCC 11550]
MSEYVPASRIAVAELLWTPGSGTVTWRMSFCARKHGLASGILDPCPDWVAQLEPQAVVHEDSRPDLDLEKASPKVDTGQVQG